MTSARPTPMNDDHGDQFPGALPASAPSRPTGAEERLVRMHASYVSKINSAVEADREDLARELAEETFVDESFGQSTPGGPHELTRERRTAGRRSPDRAADGRRPGQATTTLSRMGRLTRRSLDRFERYTGR